MKKKNIFILTASLVLASAILLAFNTSSTKSKSIPCKEGMDKCCKKTEDAPTGGAVWESLSRQFITVSGL